MLHTDNLTNLTKKELSARLFIAKQSLKAARKSKSNLISEKGHLRMIRQYENTVRKIKKAWAKKIKRKRNLLHKEQKRKKRAKWRIFRIVKRGLARIKDPVKAEAFKKKFKHVLNMEVIYTPFETEVISGLKNQKIVRRKNFKHLAYYRNKGLNKFLRRSSRWDFQYHNRIREANVSSSVPKHAKEVFITRKVFKHFYGSLKNSKLKKIYNSVRYKRGKVLNFSYSLESRLCIVLCRLGFIKNVSQSKEIIRQGGAFVNNRIIKFPDFKVRVGDFVHVTEKVFLQSFFENIYTVTQGEISEIYDKTFTEMPHLYVKQRLLLGTILYNPTNINQLLFEQKPSIFFGSDKVDYDKTVNTTKLGQSKKMFNRFVEKQAVEVKRENQKGPFVKYHNNATRLTVSLIPPERIINVCAYLMKH